MPRRSFGSPGETKSICEHPTRRSACGALPATQMRTFYELQWLSFLQACLSSTARITALLVSSLSGVRCGPYQENPQGEPILYAENLKEKHSSVGDLTAIVASIEAAVARLEGFKTAVE